MNFADIEFWGLLIGGFIVIALVRCFFKKPEEWFDKTALFCLGIFLLGNVSSVTLFIFLAVALGSYFGLKWILDFHGSAPKPYLAVLIPLQLLPLLFYKYGDFFSHQVLHLNLSQAHQFLNRATGHQFSTLRDLVIPVGISFYTFQKVAFVVDTLVLKKPLPKFLDYLNFAGFFPQIVAGPIERRNDLLPQMERFRFSWSPSDINEGACWIVLGLFFKCCLADNYAALFRGNASATSAYSIWLDNIIFGLRIYFDFAGYGLTALGLARCIGIKLTLNFAAPYCSRSVAEFWHRWNITLSQWLRDYLYIPLGGGRTKWWALNIIIVFFVSGLWHGAGWGFILWGVMHGLFLVINRVSRKIVSLPDIIGWLLTITASFLAWLCFYETRTGVLFSKLKAIFTPSAYSMAAFREALLTRIPADWFLLMVFFVIAGIILITEWFSLKKHDDPYAILRRPAVVIFLVMLTVLLAPTKNNGFIYFAF